MSNPDFEYNRDRTQVRCRVCSAGVPEERRGWLQLKSAVKHLGSNDHQKSLELLEDARRVAQQLHTERQAESAAKDLRSLQFVPGPNLRGPVASTSSAGGPSAAETEMWDDYALNGAVFDAGDDADDPHIRHERLREESRIFGLWNPEATAKQLGMGDEDIAAGILGEDEEDDFLAEIMRAVGECRVLTLREVRLCHMMTTLPQTGIKSGDHPFWPRALKREGSSAFQCLRGGHNYGFLAAYFVYYASLYFNSLNIRS